MPYSEIGPFELLQARQVIESNITGFAASQISFNELQELKKIISLQENAIAAESDRFEDPIIVFIALLPKRRKIGYSSNKPLNYGGQCVQKTPAGRNLTTSTCMKSICVCNGWKITGLFSGSATERFRARQEASSRHLENSKMN